MSAHTDLSAQPELVTDANGAPQALRTPHLLVLLLLSRCNNRCRFCMVEGEAQASSELPADVARQLVRQQPASSWVEFFGGEPTIYPAFEDLLALARERGHPCAVASNGRAFSSEAFTTRMARHGAAHIYVRTSLYGADAQRHDYYTRAPGSFAQTLTGLRNLARHGFTTQVNVVVMRHNLAALPQTVDLVASLGVPRIKFGMLVLSEHCLEEEVTLTELRPALASAARLALAHGLQLTIEKAPLCAAPEFVSHFACERQIAPVQRSYDDAGPCGPCIVRPWCPGLDPLYARRHGSSELLPLASVPASQVQALAPAQPAAREPEPFRVQWIRFEPIWREDIVALHNLADAKQRIAARLGELALIPSHLLSAG